VRSLILRGPRSVPARRGAFPLAAAAEFFVADVIWVRGLAKRCGVDLAKGGAGVGPVAGFGVWLAAIQAKARRKRRPRRMFSIGNRL